MIDSKLREYLEGGGYKELAKFLVEVYVDYFPLCLLLVLYTT